MSEPIPDELLRQELIQASNSTFGRSRKLVAVLGKIAARRDPGFLYDILWMLWDKNAEIVYEACAAISVLIARIPAVELPVVDAQLRVRWPMLGGMRSLDGEQLDRLKQSKTWWGSFALLASHGSGFVRQVAVEQLAKDETNEGLPFLLLRTSDWVEEVRNAARQVIAARLKEISPTAWARCLPLVFRMRGMSRHQPVDLLEAVEQVVVGQPDFLKTNFAADHLPAFLRYRYRLAKAYTPISLEALIASALEQKSLGVRLLACEWVLEEKNEVRRRHFAQMLLRDKAPIVRARAFWKIASASPEEYAGQIEVGIMDRSEAVQNVARGIWRLH